MRSDKKFFLLAMLVLALGTLTLYSPVGGFSFINFDDDEYVADNPVTQAGLTWAGFKWAFNGVHVGNWHPLSWLSHMLDCQLFGVNPGAHHLVNVAFHIANVLLLFAFLRATTGAQWRSAFVAALFAWHPLHVESVAWIAERKDVLSTFFWLLTLLAYARYVQSSDKWRAASGESNSSPVTHHSSLFYLLALTGCAAALLSKPMAVTLPFTLLLLDVWPLKRIRSSEFRVQNLKRLVIEKIPFFILSLGLCVVTFLSQRGAGAMSPVEWQYRLGNVPVAYARYLSKLFWPTDLAIVYPYVYHWPVLAIVGSVLLLVVVSALAVRLFQQRPWLACGWFWFVGTLVPVIGFVQVGAQSMADRYSYVPSIGLFVAVVWGATEICAARLNGKIILSALGGSALLGCVLAAALQIDCWRNSSILFLHALDVTQNNYVADNALGKAFEKNGDNLRALVLYREAVRIEPRYAISQYNYGLALIAFGEKAQAFPHLAAAAKLDPLNADAQFNLGVFFLQEKQLAEAAQSFVSSLKLRPAHAPAHFQLGLTQIQMKQFGAAAAQFREALRWQKNFPDAQKELAALLAAHPELK
jgi:protein O-mannosyl-transferase